MKNGSARRSGPLPFPAPPGPTAPAPFARVRAGTATLCLLAAACAADAAPPGAWPSRPLQLLVHVSPGSSADVAARELARGLEPVLGRNVLVVNRVGGNGVVQLAAVKASNPDGHTLAINTTSHLALFATVARGQHQRTDFAWVARLQLDPFVVYAQASSPLKSLRDFVDLARRRASDGKPIPVGGSLAAGGAHHIAFSMLAKSAGFDFAWIPFQGGDHVTSVLGGHLDAGHANPGTIEPLVRAGKLRVIGVFSDRRLPDFPDAPTYAETGFKADTRWMQTRGIFMHRDTPVAVQNALAAAIRTVTRTDAWRSYLANSNQIDGFQGPADYTAFVAVQERITLEWLTSLGLL